MCRLIKRYNKSVIGIMEQCSNGEWCTYDEHHKRLMKLYNQAFILSSKQFRTSRKLKIVGTCLFFSGMLNIFFIYLTLKV